METKSVYNMTAGEIFANMNGSEKDTLYRLLWSNYVYDDVEAFIMDEWDKGDEFLALPEDEQECCIEAAVNLYVYDGQYDCNLSYWNNIKNILDIVIKE